MMKLVPNFRFENLCVILIPDNLFIAENLAILNFGRKRNIQLGSKQALDNMSEMMGGLKIFARKGGNKGK